MSPGADLAVINQTIYSQISKSFEFLADNERPIATSQSSPPIPISLTFAGHGTEKTHPLRSHQTFSQRAGIPAGYAGEMERFF